MAEALKIKIEVAGGGDGGGSSAAAKFGVKSKTAKENAKAFYIMHQALNVGKGLARQVTNTYISHTAFYGGNTVLAEQMQNNISVIKQGIEIGAAFIANPILGGIALLTKTASAVDNYFMQMKTIERQNYAADQLARRAGYLSNKNR